MAVLPFCPRAASADGAISPPHASVASGGEGSGVGGLSAYSASDDAPYPRPLPAMLRMGGGETVWRDRVLARWQRVGMPHA